MPDCTPTIKQQIQELPSVVELKKQARALKAFGRLHKIPSTVAEAQVIEKELARITGIVERFYKTLGDRHWVFSDALDLDEMEQILKDNDPDQVEAELIAYFKKPNKLTNLINRLNRFPEMRPRLDLLRKAEVDYKEGRYYSTVLVVVSVMDGFVNDINPAKRKGLHAKQPQEMESEDCVASVLAGLPSVQSVFTKSVHKRIDDPLYEVERHALMHGMATNYDNEIIASKAWCILFAIADWASSKQIKTEPKQENSNIADSIKYILKVKKKNEISKKLLDQWTEHEVDTTNPKQPDREIIRTLEEFCTAWVKGNYGRLSDFLPNYTHKSKGAMAGEARELYAPNPITEFEIIAITRPAAARATATIRLKSVEHSWQASIPLARLNENSEAACEWEPGEWKVFKYGTAPFSDTGTA